MIKGKIGTFFAALAIAFVTFVGVSYANEVRVCTGVSGGNYDYFGKLLKNQFAGSELEVSLVPSNGAWDNLEKMNKGECDVGIVQSDTLYSWNKERGSFPYFDISSGGLYTEFAHLLCNRNSNVKEFADLTETTKVFTGGRGSGADVTIRSIVVAEAEHGNGSYTKVPLINENKPEVALVKVKSKAADCLFYVGAKGNKFMTVEAEKAKKDVVLVPIVDKDINDLTITDANGNSVSVWTPVEMDDSMYQSIMPAGVFGNSDLETVGVSALFIATDEWVNSNSDGFATLGLEIDSVVNILRAERGVELITE